MKEEYKDFVGIYDESVPVELCNVFVKNWDEAKKNQTIIDVSKENQTHIVDKIPPQVRKDEVAYVAPLISTIYPPLPVNSYFEYLQKCFYSYIRNYTIQFEGTMYNDQFKIHKVKKSQGFHAWHYERGAPEGLDRLMVYMTYLDIPKEGGETEFLHQSLRIKPIVGRTLIWPAGYTHVHRGNPPIDGEKMYIDGWFTASRSTINNSPNK